MTLFRPQFAGFAPSLVEAARVEQQRRATVERIAADSANAVPFSLEAMAGHHAKQLAFMSDTAPWIHILCARQAGKSWGDVGLLIDNALKNPYSTGIFLGLNSVAVRQNIWEPIVYRLFDRFSDLNRKWFNETRMTIRFPNGARIIFGGYDDWRHIKNLLGGRLDHGVIVLDEAQDAPALIQELVRAILPPMLTPTSRVIMSGVLPDTPAGYFYSLAADKSLEDAPELQQSKGWSHHEWGRAANIHTPEAMEQLQAYMTLHGIDPDDPQIQRDWYVRRTWDPSATAYRYLPSRNGYEAQAPDWLAPLWELQRDVYVRPDGQPGWDRQLLYCHPLKEDKRDGVRYGLIAAKPNPGITTFSFAIDPGSTSDRCAIEGTGWGSASHKVQQVFEWSTPRGMQLTTGQIFAVAALAHRMFSRLGGVIEWRYDAGSSQNTIDNLLNDYGIALVLAAKKTDLLGQVGRVNDLLTQDRFDVIKGSALEQDFHRARWDKAALEKGQRKWASSHHPDPSEAARYSVDPYVDGFVAPKQATVFDNPALRALMAAQNPNPDRPDYT